ncbi:MAG TPA: DUF192 domain-containing protein [Steroidobacteraceae bacterium]|nr:DUF192 domain-containing protein [Steroidobacteraceae bacterium]
MSTAATIVRGHLVAGALALASIVAMAQGQAGLEPLDAFPRSSLEIQMPKQRHRFEVWVADTNPRRAQGLMHVKALQPMHGMLFVYPEPRMVSMWMKNTVIPLDMLFVAADGHIIRIARRTHPLSLETITSMGPVVGVIELAGGEAERLGIETGARVVHPAFKTG